MRKRTLIITVAVAIIVLVVLVGSHQFDGPVQAVNPQVAVRLMGSESWWEHPRLDATLTDSDGVYVHVPAMPVDDRFPALRIDVHTGVQAATTITISPQSSFRSFIPAAVHAEVSGVRFRRLTLQLLSLPGGGGWNDHFIDSATGRINVVLDEGDSRRVLLTRKAFNSSSTDELLARVTADPTGRWIAAVWRDSGSWRLYLFSRNSTAGAQPTKDKSYETETR